MAHLWTPLLKAVLNSSTLSHLCRGVTGTVGSPGGHLNKKKRKEKEKRAGKNKREPQNNLKTKKRLELQMTPSHTKGV